MKYVYALIVAGALSVGCNAAPTQESTSRDISQMIDNQQRVVVLSMAMQTGDGGDAARAIAAANSSKYEIARTRLAQGTRNTVIALK